MNIDTLANHVRNEFGEHDVISTLESHLGDTPPISERQIAAFLYGVYAGSHATSNILMDRFSGVTQTLANIYDSLKEGMRACEDIPSLEVFHKAIEIVEKENARQMSNSAALILLEIERASGVSVALIQGAKETQDDIQKAAMHMAANDPLGSGVFLLGGPEAVKVARTAGMTMIEFISNLQKFNDESERKYTPDQMGAWAIEEARRAYNEAMDKADSILSAPDTREEIKGHLDKALYKMRTGE